MTSLKTAAKETKGVAWSLAKFFEKGKRGARDGEHYRHFISGFSGRAERGPERGYVALFANIFFKTGKTCFRIN